MFRRFKLLRLEDESGVSGEGIVCHGVQFPSGRCVMEWDTDMASIGVYDSIEHVERVHGHGGKTRVVWVDQETPKRAWMKSTPAS